MIGQTISRYEITEKLGEGGMGVVYKALDTKLDRPVALKFLAAQLLEDEEARERFTREAKAAAALNHPNICTVYEIDEADGQSFIAMEFVEGGNVRERIRKRPLPLDEALDIAIQTAEGLQVAHEKGIVHRDIKASNLIVTLRGRVKIMDFGLAQLTGRSHFTNTATILGTLAYMSPEQARRLPTDRRTDVWSLAVVIYEMVCGRLPFEAEREEAVSYSIVHEAPEPLTARRVGLPVELDYIVGKALAKSADERYQHVDEMVVDLRGVRQATEPRSAKPESAGPRPRPPPGAPSSDARSARDEKRSLAARPKRRLGIIAAVVGLGAISAALWWSARNDAPSEPADATTELASIAVLPFENLSGDPEQEFFSDGMSSEVIGSLSSVQSLRVISWTTARRYKNTDKSAPEIGAELDVAYLLEGAAMRAGDDVRITVHLTDARRDRQIWSDSFEGPLAGILRLHREVAQAVAPEIEGRLTVPAWGTGTEREVPPEAYVAYLKGLEEHRRDLRADSLTRALAYHQQAVEAAPNFAAAHAGLALIYQGLSWEVGTEMSMAEAQSRARAAMRKALSLDPNQPTALRVKGDSAAYDWDWAGARETFEAALEVFPSHSGIRISYAHALAGHGRFEDAREEILRAYRLDPQASELAIHLAGIHYLTRDYDSAEEFARRMLEAFPRGGHGFIWLANVALAREQYDAAVSILRQAPANDDVLALQVYAYGRNGDRESAARALDQLKSIASTMPVSPVWWARAYTGLGDKDKALEWLEQAFRERDVWLVHLGIDPMFDPLRSEPRFRALVEKMNLPFSYSM